MLKEKEFKINNTCRTCSYLQNERKSKQNKDLLKHLNKLFGCKPTYNDKRAHGKSFKWDTYTSNLLINNHLDLCFKEKIESNIIEKFPELKNKIKVTTDKNYIRVSHRFHV